MRKSVARIKGLGFILWHGKHEFYHVLLGVAWAWFLREQWGYFSVQWLVLSIFGSILPDFEHLQYFISHRKKDGYAQQVIEALRQREWRFLTLFIEKGHKHNTNLALHNIYVIGVLFVIVGISSFNSWHMWIVLTGAMIIHYIFDILDDIITLGYVNPNWKRWGREKKVKKEKMLQAWKESLPAIGYRRRRKQAGNPH